MFAKQLSVFIENRQGRLGEVLSVLKKNNVNILSMSLADTTEYGLLRLIVNNPELGKEKLAEEGFSSLLKSIELANINIEYMYGLSLAGEKAYVVLKASDLEITKKTIEDNGGKTVAKEVLAAM